MALVGERKALSAAILVFFALIHLAAALAPPDPSFQPLLGAMAATYGMAFFGLVAGYFWARWFAIGLGLYGLAGGALMIWQVGLDYIFVFYGGTHGLVSVVLWGDKVAADYDGRPDWRERFHMDEHATRRLGRSIIRVGASLPLLLAYGLAPRGSMGEALVVAAAVGLAGLGVYGLLRLRTWGLLAVLAGGIAVLGSAAATTHVAPAGSGVLVDLLATGVTGAVLLLTATLPFARPVARYLRG